MNEVLLVIFGSLAGILTAVAIEMRPKERIKNNNSKFVYEMVKKIDEYKKLGIITEEESEELLSAYKDKIPSDRIVIQKVDLTPIKQELITLLDQRISEINAKIDNLKIREEAKRSSNRRSMNQKSNSATNSPMPINIKNDEAEDERRELEEIKKRIFDTLSKLEGTEVG